MRRGFAALVLSGLLAAAFVPAQAPPPPVSGAAGLELMLRRLETTGVVMIVNAHPDDEPNALIAMLVHGLGMRVVEVTATRGEGGQNDLGPEQGLALSVLRTSELLSVHKIDGAEQLFTHAVDFGYSFSVEETFAKWGHDEVLADLVRLIRMVRPDVIITMSPEGEGGGQHHQASARLAREAFEKAGLPNEFQDQIEQGLKAWLPSRLYVPIGGPPAADGGAASRPASRRAGSRPAEKEPESRPGDVVIDTDVFDVALGCTYHEIGTRARGMHKSQGMAKLGALPGPSVQRYRLAAGSVPGETAPRPAGQLPAAAFFDGIDVSLRSLQHSTVDLGAAISTLKDCLQMQLALLEARQALARGEPAAAIEPLVRGFRAASDQREALAKRREWDPRTREVDALLERKQDEFKQAIALAGGVRIEALADAGVVTPGQEIKVTVYVANRLGTAMAFGDIAFIGVEKVAAGCDTRPSCALPAGGLVSCESKVRIPKDARLTSAHWKASGGSSRSEWEPDVPFGAPFRPTPFRGWVGLVVCGQLVTYVIPVEFRDGSDVFAGEKRHELLVVPAGPDADYRRIEYPHVERRHLVWEPKCVRPTFDLKLAADPIGWFRGIGDGLDEAIHCLGPVAEPLDEGAIKRGLGRFPVVVVGARAFELRPEVRAAGKTLLKYVEEGGTLIILYQRSGLDETTAAPYPGKTSDKRITDENAPVTFLVPDHLAFNKPFKLGPEDWAGWVSERGRSFFETTDYRYVDLLESEDPFPFNKGKKRGILVEARFGKGRWIYCGLALSRQLEEGVPGAYRLLANLLSLRGE
jgi:LmbE family N-acetylglucosaminyl deacetylase